MKLTLAALTAATLALPAAAQDRKEGAKCAPQAGLSKCAPKCGAKKCAPKKNAAKCGAKKCAPKCGAKCAPKS
ncbi:MULTISPECIES: hypothetical protein [Acidovorax]|uniref:hypothetical protein n=1 Tax=Acidovorax TaxID=12916 RepID=UPI0025848283|nr:hypothetical protein [Acidovorax sp.]